MVERKYFGTDGVRGIAGQFPLTTSWVMHLGAVAGDIFKQSSENPTVIIGKDTRQSSDMLEAALSAGLTSRGVTVLQAGILPTPGVSYLTRYHRADAGIVISASHNPYLDNGIKFFGSDGQKLDDRTEHEIEHKLATELSPDCDGQFGAVKKITSSQPYTQFLRQHAPDLTGLRIALDCAHGAAYEVAPQLFRDAGAEVHAISVMPNGCNINHECGSTHLDQLQHTVKNGAYDLGIAFDGDADRALLIDSRGHTIHGDHILLLNARARKVSTVVTTIMSNMALEHKLHEAGIAVERTAVGDRYVYECLQDKDLMLGGEQSGHILFLDISPTGDGILTALLTLKSMQLLQTTLDDLYDELIMYPQILLNVRVDDKKMIIKDQAVQATVQAAQTRLMHRGRVNLRPSGTENLIRIMVEGPDQTEIQDIADHLEQIVKKCNCQNKQIIPC